MPLRPHAIKRTSFLLIASLLLLAPPSRAANDTLRSARINNALAVGSVSEIDDAQFLVTQHYRDFLNREPDEVGLQFWTSNITSCGADAQCREVKRINVSAAFFLSIEFQETAYLAYRTRQLAFNVGPTLRWSDFLTDQRSLSAGVVIGQPGATQQLEENKRAYFDAFVNRQDFLNAFPASMSAAQFVDVLNGNSLDPLNPSAGGSLSQAERDSLVAALAGGTLTRAQVLRAVAEDADFRAREFNRAFVLMEYFGYLRRNPNEGPDTNFDGYNFWLNKLNQFGGDFVRAEMVKAFLASLEYRERFVAPQQVTRVIPPGGGTITQPGFASVTFPTGSFPGDTTVRMAATHEPEAQDAYLTSADIFNAGLRNPFEVRLNTGLVAPASSLDVTLQVPDNFIRSLPADAEVRVFAQIFQDGGDEILDNFELLSSKFDAAAKTVRVTLPNAAFTKQRQVDETYEAVIVVGTTPTKPLAASSVALNTALLPGPTSLLDFQTSSTRALVEAAVAECEGTSLGSPLPGTLNVRGAFNPNAGEGRNHYGVDYRASNGTDVLAAADGKIKVVKFNEKPLKKPHPRSGKLVQGFGLYVVLEHPDGSTTLYGHLMKDSVGPGDIGKPVKKGDVIAKSNDSGGSEAPHLHFEYAPTGRTFAKDGRVDPHPCVGSNVSGSITVRDNGSLADDAFRVSLDGNVLGTTSIGASNTFAINNLRSGQHTLTILCTIAPDDVGTFEVTLTQGLTFSGGGTSVSSTLPQGGSQDFIITAPAR